MWWSDSDSDANNDMIIMAMIMDDVYGDIADDGNDS